MNILVDGDVCGMLGAGLADGGCGEDSEAALR